MLGGEERMHRWPGSPYARAGRPWRRSLAGALCGGLAGFLLGATFWIVLGLQELTGAGAPRLAPAGDPPAVEAPQCTSLAIDRRRGRTTAEPCLGHVLPLREANAITAGDHAQP